MTLRILWTPSYCPQDLESLQQTTQPDSLPVFSLKITHREGEVAVAHLTIPQGIPINNHQWACISLQEEQKNTILFYGKPIGMPLHLDAHTQKIELLALPQDVHEQHHLLMESLKKEDPCKTCFMDAHQEGDPSEYLESRPSLFCYDRITHQVSLSSLFEGRETLHLKNQILKDNFHVKLADSPLSGIHLQISCEWVQEAEGEFNLMPALHYLFPQGILNTLTPQALLQNWPLRGQLLGRSGYGIIRSHLSSINPNTTGSLHIYPTLTPLFAEQRYSRYWLQGELILSWQYRQKRREILLIPLLHKTQMTHAQPRPPRRLKLKLNQTFMDTIPKLKGRFLDTPEAQPLIEQALKIAQCHLAYSARALEITLQLPLKEALDLHLDQSIHVHHPCLPKDGLKGKLMSYTLEKTIEKSIATLQIGLSVGMGEEETLSTLSLTSPPVEGIEHPEDLAGKDFIEHLSVSYGADEQIQYLKNLLDEQKEVLTLPPLPGTQIALQLKDLRTEDVLKRTLQAAPLTWSAPYHTKGDFS